MTGGCGLFMWSRTGSTVHSFGHNNEPSVSMPCREFLQLLYNYFAQLRWPMLTMIKNPITLVQDFALCSVQ